MNLSENSYVCMELKVTHKSWKKCIGSVTDMSLFYQINTELVPLKRERLNILMGFTVCENIVELMQPRGFAGKHARRECIPIPSYGHIYDLER